MLRMLIYWAEAYILRKTQTLVVASRTGLAVNADAISTRSSLEIRMQDEVTI